MNRSRRLFALVAIATAIAACSPGAGSLGDVPTSPPSVAPSGPAPTPSPPESASMTVPSASPTTSPAAQSIDPATVLAADGIGPYAIGAAMSELQSRDLITNIEKSFHCDESWQAAEATGLYAAQLHLTFHLGHLIDIATDSSELVTPSGARVGMPLTELQSIYGSRGTLMTGVNGNQAVSVRVPDTALGIVFYLDETNTKAISMSAGEVERLEQMVVVGEGC